MRSFKKKTYANFILLKSGQYFKYGRGRQFPSVTLQTQKYISRNNVN